MFEAALAARLKRIFGLAKVTYDRPGESQEQEGIFIEVKGIRGRVRDGHQTAQVDGEIRIFAQLEKMPFGYLAQRIAQADPADKADLFFLPERNLGGQHGRVAGAGAHGLVNIVERSMEFLYFFDSQYDPAVGRIEEIDLSLAETL